MTETDLEALEATTLAVLQAALADPKPSYRVGEHEVKYNEYIQTLLSTLRFCRELLGQLPFEEESSFIR